MWKRGNPIIKIIAIAMIAVGAIILFARVLPAGFWWFCVGVALVAGGVLLLNKCR